MNKYYASGQEISADDHRDILAGKTGKLIRCPDNQPGICLAWIPDHINVVDGMLDESDPLLSTVLDAVKLPLEKTYIIQFYNPPTDPITDCKKGAIYGYW